MSTSEPYFSFVVKTDFAESNHWFDQCGVVLYLDSENWLKASIEYENDRFQHLGSVVTNHGYSDWATTEISAGVKSMWYRLSPREDDFCVECFRGRPKPPSNADLPSARRQKRHPVWRLCCSPEDSSFRAVFTHMELTECKWLAHDGQAPDEEV